MAEPDCKSTEHASGLTVITAAQASAPASLGGVPQPTRYTRTETVRDLAAEDGCATGTQRDWQDASPAWMPWPPWPQEGPLGLVDLGKTIQVFAVALDAPRAQVARLSHLLSATELERADRFYFERHRRRYLLCRGVLRTILGAILEIPAKDLEFAYGPNGKPALVDRLSGHGLQFNVSHCEDLALIAVGSSAAVGVDLERVRVLAEARELVARFFSPRENEAFQRLSPDLQPAAFFNLWTRKEAWLKATGEGIAHRLNQVEVTFLPGEPARLLSVPPDLDEVNRWTLLALAPAPEHVGALAVRQNLIEPQTWFWQWPN